MKNFKILFVLAAFIAMFSSCTEENAEPTITWTPNDLSNYVIFGNESTYNKTLDISFSAEAGIKEIDINKLVYKGDDNLFLEVSAEEPTGYSGEIDFSYTLTTNNVESDFEDGVTKIVYEVVLTDQSETPQTTVKEYIFFVNEVYTLTINVEDGEGTAITDATVTFDSTEITADPYTFEHIMAGTYDYSVEKDGYENVNVTDFEMPNQDTSITVTLLEELPTAWADTIALTIQSQTSWASYQGNPVTIYESETIGFAFSATTQTSVTVTNTSNCDGWVELTDISSITTKDDLETAYNAGTVLTTYDLPYDQHRNFETLYFVSKIGTNYVLVEYIAGHRDTTTGNVVVFQYKN